MTFLRVPEMEFTPYPAQNVELMVRAEEAIATVPRSPELVEYDVWSLYPPIMDLVEVLGYSSAEVREIAHSRGLPDDFVMYGNPASTQKRTVASHHQNGSRASVHERLNYARSHTKYMSDSLVSRAHFVAAVTGAHLGFEGVSLDHQERIGQDSEYTDFNFEDMVDGNASASNDALLFKAVLLPGSTAESSVARLLASKINDPEMSLIAYSKLYLDGDTESFQMLIAMLHGVFLGEPQPYLSIIGDSHLKAVNKFMSSLLGKAVELNDTEQITALLQVRGRLNHNPKNRPGAIILRHMGV